MGTLETFLNQLDRRLALLKLINYRLQPAELEKIEGVERDDDWSTGEALILKKDRISLWIDLGLPDPDSSDHVTLWQLHNVSVCITIGQAEDDVFSLEVERRAEDGSFHMNCAYDHADGLPVTPVMQQLTEIFDIAIGATKPLDENTALEAIGRMNMVMQRIFSEAPLPTKAS